MRFFIRMRSSNATLIFQHFTISCIYIANLNQFFKQYFKGTRITSALIVWMLIFKRPMILVKFSQLVHFSVIFPIYVLKFPVKCCFLTETPTISDQISKLMETARWTSHSPIFATFLTAPYNKIDVSCFLNIVVICATHIQPGVFI